MKKEKMFSIVRAGKHSMRGFTLVEVIVALLILSIIMLFGTSFFGVSRVPLGVAKQTSFALQKAEDDIETLKAGPFTSIVTLSPANQTIVDPATGITFTWHRKVTSGGAGNTFKEITETVTWTGSAGSGTKDYTVSLKTIIALAFPASN